MPFTFAHPAAVLPLLRYTQNDAQKLALIIGSMAPDLPYYLNLAFPAHTPKGLFFVALPLAWLCLLTIVLAQPIFKAGLPSVLRAKLPLQAKLKELRVTRITAWILVGAITHIFWDSFTHARNAIAIPTPKMQFGPWPLYFWLQHASTIIGLSILLAYYRADQVLFARSSADRLQWRMLSIAFIVAGIAGASYGCYAAGRLPDYFWRVFFFKAAIASTQIFVLLFFLSSFLKWRWQRQQQTT